MGPEGRLIGVGDAGDDSPDEPGVQSLLEVHVLDRLHGLPLGELSCQAGDLGLGLSAELLISGLLGDGLGIDSCDSSSVRGVRDLESLVLGFEGVNHSGDINLLESSS